MINELQLQNVLKKKCVIYETIPCVFFYNRKSFCMEHPKLKGMNLGAMRQHIEGKAHQLNFITGKPINKIDVSEIYKMIKESQNQVPIKSEREGFDNFHHILTTIFKVPDRTQAMIIAKYTLKDEKRIDVQNHLHFLDLKEKEQAEDEKQEAKYQEARKSLNWT